MSQFFLELEGIFVPSVEPHKAQQTKISVLMRHLKTVASFIVFVVCFVDVATTIKFKKVPTPFSMVQY